MKNILISIVTILLIVLTVVIMIKGITIGELHVSSIEEITQKSSELKEKVDKTKNLNESEYKKTLEDLQTSVKTLKSAKTSYLDVASVSSDKEIKAANQEQIYAMEYLWSRIGNHATLQGVNLKLDVDKSKMSGSTLSFKAVGEYDGILNFVEALENDTNLNFRIQEFKIVMGKKVVDGQPVDDPYNLVATFTVTDINVKEEEVTTKIVTGDENNNNKNTTSNIITNNVTATNNSTSD